MLNRFRVSLQAVLVVCSLLCLSTGGVTRAGQETPEQVLDRLKKAIQSDDRIFARKALTQETEPEPQSAEESFIAAKMYCREGARSSAIRALHKAIEYQPVYPEAHLLLAQCLVDGNNPDEAREQVDIALAQGIPGLGAYRVLARLDIAKADFKAAIGSLETALRYSTSADADEEIVVREQLSKLREFIEKFARLTEREKSCAGPEIVSPVLVETVGPHYSEEARKLKIQGTVAMVLLITEAGDVGTTLIFRSLGYGLDEQAIEAARQFKFQPATDRGEPIRCWKMLAVEFNLR